jgi:HAD superfamily hydrolase (TIGR01484 family)
VSKRPKLIATDLDGTIVHHDGTITQRTIDAFTRARDLGVHIYFVTGRPPRWMNEIRETFSFGEAICGNGAMLYDLQKKIKWKLHEECVRQFRKFLLQLKPMITTTAKKHMFLGGMLV